jgi:hypothetical protein
MTARRRVVAPTDCFSYDFSSFRHDLVRILTALGLFLAGGCRNAALGMAR